MSPRALSVTAVVFALIAVLAGALAPRLGDAQGESRAGLVVEYGDGSVQTYCVAFPGESISGEDLLRASGLSIVASEGSSFGAGICQIEGEGCADPNNCFCQCQGGSCEFWRYYHAAAGAWSFSNVGATGWQLGNGDVDGWAWGGDGAQPPYTPFEQICEVAPTPEPTEEPPPPPTWTATQPPPEPTQPAPPTPTLPPPTSEPTTDIQTTTAVAPVLTATMDATGSSEETPLATRTRRATPTATATPDAPTPTPEGPRVVATTGEEREDDDDGGGTPAWTYALFGALAVALGGMALFIGRGRGA